MYAGMLVVLYQMYGETISGSDDFLLENGQDFLLEDGQNLLLEGSS